MEKELLIKNLDESIGEYGLELTEDDLNWIATVGYEQMKNWTYRNFANFAKEVNRENGNYLYVLVQNNWAPDLTEKRMFLNDWFSDHPQQIKDVLAYVDVEVPEDETEAYDSFDYVDTDEIIDWLDEHEQAYKDCLYYVAEHI